jgi:hypothetical protein
MKRTTMAAPNTPALYNRVRQIPDSHTKLLKVQKGHAPGDQFSAFRMVTGVTNQCWKIALSAERRPIGDATRNQLKVLRTPCEIFDAPGQVSDAVSRKFRSATPGSVLPPIRHAARGKSGYPGYALPGVRWERANHGG